MYGLASLYQVSVRIISNIYNEPQICYLGDRATIDSITVCFLSSAERYYALREIPSIIIDGPVPLPILPETSSPGDNIDSKDNAVIQENQIQIPTGSAGIPAPLTKIHLLKPLNMTTEVCVRNEHCFPPRRVTWRSPGIPAPDTLIQENIIDIGLHGEGTPVVYWPCFQMGVSASEHPKRRPRPKSRRSLDVRVETPISQQCISFQQRTQVA